MIYQINIKRAVSHRSRLNGINQFDVYHRTGFSIEKSAKSPLFSGMVFFKILNLYYHVYF